MSTLCGGISVHLNIKLFCHMPDLSVHFSLENVSSLDSQLTTLTGSFSHMNVLLFKPLKLLFHI